MYSVFSGVGFCSVDVSGIQTLSLIHEGKISKQTRVISFNELLIHYTNACVGVMSVQRILQLYLKHSVKTECASTEKVQKFPISSEEHKINNTSDLKHLCNNDLDP